MTRDEYITIMNGTQYGWKSKGTPWETVGCPDDLMGIDVRSYPKGTCCTEVRDCKECWEYVLNTYEWDEG